METNISDHGKKRILPTTPTITSTTTTTAAATITMKMTHYK